MTPTEIIAHARREGIELLTDGGDRLGYRAPVGVVDAALVETLTLHKPGVLAILAADVLPCPQCARPLDAFECCWECRGRLCQACGVWMAQRAYARECGACLAVRFAELDQERHGQECGADVDNPHLHACPGCTAQGRPKLIPTLWTQCAVCDPDWRERRDTR